MKVLVLVKETFDTNFSVKIDDNNLIDDNNIKYIINPYDEHAITLANELKKSGSSETVILLLSSSSKSKDTAVKTLAMGGDRAIVLKYDGNYSSKLFDFIADIVNKNEIDFVITGEKTIDDNDIYRPAVLGAVLNWNNINFVNKIENINNGFYIYSNTGKDNIKYEISLPFVMGVSRSINNVKFVSLANIMKARRKKIDYIDFKNNQKTENKYSYPKPRSPGLIFKDEKDEIMVDKLLKVTGRLSSPE